MQRVNYDKIAHLYDEPLRDYGVDGNLLAFVTERPDIDPSSLAVLDVGCGTGKQQTANWTVPYQLWPLLMKHMRQV